MTIDLKWALPFVMPFVVLGFFRALWWAAGAEWSEPWAGAAVSAVVGVVIGVFVTCSLAENGIYWNVKIGKARRGK